MKRIALALVSLVLIGLAGCSSPAEETNWTELGPIDKIACHDSQRIITAINDAANVPHGTVVHNNFNSWLKSQELTPDQAIKRLSDRCVTQASATPTATATTLPETPTSTTPSNIKDWGQVVENPSPGLPELVEAHKATTGISWANIQEWANARMPNGDRADARVIVVIGDNNITNDQARNRTGLTGTTVPVIHVDGLRAVSGQNLQGVRVILAPLEINSKGRWAFREFHTGLLNESGMTLAPVVMTRATW